MKRIFTLQDARRERALAEDRAIARSAKRNARLAERQAIPAGMHPAIGVLQTAKGVKFYAIVDGVYREGTPAHLAQMLTGN